MATMNKLSPQVVEKDYVLGWLLAGINQHGKLGNHWIFKGGTCLRKCYFDGYRFSEDLDFTLAKEHENHLDSNFLFNAFTEIANWLYEKIGIELPLEKMVFDQYKEGACQGRVYYRGPIAPHSDRQLPKIKLDLTTAEIIVDKPIHHLLKHPYQDPELQHTKILCYSYVELFAEKTRALVERARPRDLYDVINFYRNADSQSLAKEVYKVLEKKCVFKNIKIPEYTDLLIYESVCRAGWDIQLAHQLQSLPVFESYWNDLPIFFHWLHNPEN